MFFKHSTNILGEKSLGGSNVQNDALDPNLSSINFSSSVRKPFASVIKKVHPFPAITAERLANMKIEPGSTNFGAVQVNPDKRSWAQGYVVEENGQIPQLTDSRSLIPCTISVDPKIV